MPQLAIKSGSRAAQTIDLPSGTIRLGRDRANDFSFDDATVSSRHCEVILQDGTVRVHDLGSTNGTFIDGQQIKEAVLLPGQTLHLGSVEIAFEDAPAHIAIPALTPQQPNPLLSARRPAGYNHSASLAPLECGQGGRTVLD